MPVRDLICKLHTCKQHNHSITGQDQRLLYFQYGVPNYLQRLLRSASYVGNETDNQLLKRLNNNTSDIRQRHTSGQVFNGFSVTNSIN